MYFFADAWNKLQRMHTSVMARAVFKEANKPFSLLRTILLYRTG